MSTFLSSLIYLLCFSNNRRPKPIVPQDDPENVSSISEEIFSECEKLKQKILSLPNGKPDIWLYRQELLDQYGQLILFDLDYALEKKIEHDLWTVVFKNEINFKQEQLKENNQNQIKRTEIQTSLQTLYEYARGYYLKLLQVGHRNFDLGSGFESNIDPAPSLGPDPNPTSTPAPSPNPTSAPALSLDPGPNSTSTPAPSLGPKILEPDVLYSELPGYY